MSEKRDTFRYELLNGDKMVAVGNHHSPHRVARDYSTDGLEVSDVRIIGPAISREAAEIWVEQRLYEYRRENNGKNPRYNPPEIQLDLLTESA